MSYFIAALIVFAVVMIIMAVGVVLGGREIKGSCGGLNAVSDPEGNMICGVCGQQVDDRGKPLAPEASEICDVKD